MIDDLNYNLPPVLQAWDTFHWWRR